MQNEGSINRGCGMWAGLPGEAEEEKKPPTSTSQKQREENLETHRRDLFDYLFLPFELSVASPLSYIFDVVTVVGRYVIACQCTVSELSSNMKKIPAGFARQSFQIEGIQISNADKEGGPYMLDGLRRPGLIEEEAIKLPSGDFVISWSPAGFPVITRTPSAKAQCPDRLNLDKQRLTLCPILEGEAHLRLLNYQHNLITRIENLSNLTKLIFLDLYDNQISSISGLEMLKSLRVLMLGKNRIKKIENVGCLRKLDVLDLHNNQLTRIENLDQLQELRVLNLAGNQIRKVESLRGLHSLTELNLRRNLIETVRDCEFLGNLKQLYLSYNMIARFEDVANIALCRSLVEVALDGNPLCQGPCYRIATIKQLPQIKQLDLKRISEEERQVANAYKIGTPVTGALTTSSAHSDSSAINGNGFNGKSWQQHLAGGEIVSSSAPVSREQGSSDQMLRQPSSNNIALAAATGTAMATAPTHSLSKPTTFKIKIPGGVSISQQLDVYDIESLYKATHPGVQSPANITTISFNRINFNDIAPHLSKLKTYYPTLSVICFNECNIETLVQLVQLTAVRRIQQIVIGFAGNPVTGLTYWKPFLAWRTGVNMVNGDQIPESELGKMEQIFGFMPVVPPSSLTVNPKIREHVLKYVRDTREEAIRGVDNTSQLRYMQDLLVLDLIRRVANNDSASS